MRVNTAPRMNSEWPWMRVKPGRSEEYALTYEVKAAGIEHPKIQHLRQRKFARVHLPAERKAGSDGPMRQDNIAEDEHLVTAPIHVFDVAHEICGYLMLK